MLNHTRNYFKKIIQTKIRSVRSFQQGIIKKIKKEIELDCFKSQFYI